MTDNSERSRASLTSNKVTLEVTTAISVSLPEWNRMQDELRVLRQLINGSPAHLLVGKEHFEKACSTFINHGHCVYCGFSREAHGLPALSDEPDSVHETNCSDPGWEMSGGDLTCKGCGRKAREIFTAHDQEKASAAAVHLLSPKRCPDCGVQYVSGARHFSGCPSHPGELAPKAKEGQS